MKRLAKHFALCLENSDNEVSLVPGKVYCVVLDARATREGMLRVVDETGEDYLFARSQFALVEFSRQVRRRVLALERVDREE